MFPPYCGRTFLHKGLQVLFSKWNIFCSEFSSAFVHLLTAVTFWVLQYFVGILVCPFPQPYNSSTLKSTSPEKHKNTAKKRMIQRWWSKSADIWCPDFFKLCRYLKIQGYMVGSSILKSVTGYKQGCRCSAWESVLSRLGVRFQTSKSRIQTGSWKSGWAPQIRRGFLKFRPFVTRKKREPRNM